jgi:hypothetical protein
VVETRVSLLKLELQWSLRFSNWPAWFSSIADCSSSLLAPECEHRLRGRVILDAGYLPGRSSFPFALNRLADDDTPAY